MSQTQKQLVIDDDGSVRCYHGQTVGLQTSHTIKHPDRKFFTCCKARGASDRCSFFIWLNEIRLDPKWDEARFRRAYNLRPAEVIEGVSLGQLLQKRQVDEDVSFSSSQSPKRKRCNDTDLDDFFADSQLPARPVATSSGVLHAAAQSNPTTPSRNGGLGDQRRQLLITPPSTAFSRSRRQLAEVPSSPSEESIRRRESSRSLRLQNFEGGMDEISPLSSRESPQSLWASPSAEDLEVMIATLNSYPDLIRKLERKASADKNSLDARIRRVHQLETELEQYVPRHNSDGIFPISLHRVKEENQNLIRENMELTRQNKELSQYLHD
ncbi:hypothetical protein F5887DRAFT_641451 [Amanita rubescens]|nr:hypothetical protein F5887DRAFT_641451 [Amanita rubescens]